MLSVSANHLFLQLPSEVRAALLPHLKLEEFVRGQIVVDERFPVEKVSFPISTLLMSEAPMGNDRYAFTGLLGRHNIVGSHKFHAQPFPERKVTVIVGGLAATCPIEIFHKCHSDFESLRVVITWLQTQGHRRVAQLAACSTTHNLTERLARLLLSLKYLQGLDTIPVAHRDLAHILGVRREAISRELTLAEASGALQLQRRCIAITDENLLAARSCRCHEEMRFSGRYDYSALATLLQSRR
jgi:CRP-like cAMP-binding protein